MKCSRERWRYWNLNNLAKRSKSVVSGPLYVVCCLLFVVCRYLYVVGFKKVLERLAANIIGICQTELIEVKNRSHNQNRLF
jgi:hypothetical protein